MPSGTRRSPAKTASADSTMAAWRAFEVSWRMGVMTRQGSRERGRRAEDEGLLSRADTAVPAIIQSRGEARRRSIAYHFGHRRAYGFPVRQGENLRGEWQLAAAASMEVPA